MSTITAILEADADGTLHLPVPVELRGSKVKVTATLEASPLPAAEISDWPARRAAALATLQRIHDRGGIRSIQDPVAWQRDARLDRPLPRRAE